MRGSVLLISRDTSLLRTRGLVLQYAGYDTVQTDNLEEAQSMILFRTPDLIILCQSLEVSVQRRFIEEVQKRRLSPRILCLETSPNNPEELLDLCKDLIGASAARPQVRVVAGYG